ncbi:uncharacterized protein [Physcomitrium patens]|uniref:Uncharacterized protein n=1 Tax=Physcomitrium patens TaxID=3218 RepID=A0A7I4BPZ6_PHYPA|nr:uncharacterized protein LOC112282225 isoform X2 [Physcomitrium patens]|eukprot:XP_024375385.1 uncharacterized protein LOC112282225 isoform X2 [Physcomitrella patens]
MMMIPRGSFCGGRRRRSWRSCVSYGKGNACSVLWGGCSSSVSNCSEGLDWIGLLQRRAEVQWVLLLLGIGIGLHCMRGLQGVLLLLLLGSRYGVVNSQRLTMKVVQRGDFACLFVCLCAGHDVMRNIKVTSTGGPCGRHVPQWSSHSMRQSWLQVKTSIGPHDLHGPPEHWRGTHQDCLQPESNCDSWKYLIRTSYVCWSFGDADLDADG